MRADLFYKYMTFPKQLISSKQLSFEEIVNFLHKAETMEASLQKGETIRSMENKIMAALFYEPSTRTRLSFESAFLRLGGNVISVTGTESTSIKKGETIFDTIKVIENYADVIVMRHAEAEAIREATEATHKPLINAGNGGEEHPTQALLDLYTIQKEHGLINGTTIAFVGDLKYGRTVHSLTYLLANFKVKFVFISPEELKIPQKLRDFLQEKNLPFEETDKLEANIAKVDVLYVTRVQKERFDNQEEYERLKDKFVVDAKLVKQGKEKLSVLHPLPRIYELKKDVDDLIQAAYFKQVKNSIPARMAILDLVMQ